MRLRNRPIQIRRDLWSKDRRESQQDYRTPQDAHQRGVLFGSNFTEDFRPSSSTSIFGEADNMLNSFGMLVGWGLPMDNQTSTGADENCQRRMFFGVN